MNGRSGATPARSRRTWLGALAGLGLAAAAMPSQGQGTGAGGGRKAAPGRPARLAVVLGAGSARGFAHIGVVKALDAAGLRPDGIFGCSAGALVGAFWAAGFSGARMEALALRVRDDEVIDLVNGAPSGRLGLVTGQAVQNFVNEGLGGRRIDELPLPLHVVATRYPSGEMQVFDRGDTGFAVRASCSIPGVFLPATTEGQSFLDGGLVSPLPVPAARQRGYELVVAVDLAGTHAPQGGNGGSGSGSGLFQLLQRSFEIMGESLRRYEAERADIVIRPDVGRIASTDFGARRALIEAGMLAGQRLAPVIAERLGARR